MRRVVEALLRNYDGSNLSPVKVAIRLSNFGSLSIIKLHIP
jgi:hypothetical protein